MVWRRDTAAASCARTRALGGDWTCIHGSSIGGQFVLVATGFSFLGHRGGGACIFLARLLVVAWRAVVGGRHWTRTLACRGTNLRLHRLVATSVLRGLPAFLSLERVLSSVVLAFLSPRSVVGVGRARCNSARRAAGFACVCFAMRRRACCGAYPLFIARARFVRFRRFYRRAWPSGPMGLATAPRAGRRLASASTAATPRRRAVGSSARVGGRRRCARAPWAVFLSPCAGRGTPHRVTVLEDSARTAGGVLSSAASWQSGRLLHAPGRGSALLRRPRSVLMRRTGHFLVGFEGRPTFVQHSRAVDVADRKSGRDLSAFWRSLAVVVPPARLRCTLAARWAGQRRIVRSSLIRV